MEMTSIETKSLQLDEIREKPEDTPVVGRRVPGSVLLAFATTTQILNPSYSGMNYDVFISRDMTGPSEEEPVHKFAMAISPNDIAVEEPSDMSDADIANRDRLQLLARAYVAGKLSIEEDARLAIVTERVRRLIPRVTIEDFEAIERVAQEVERISLEDSQRRRRLGID
jgi:hypothetical protein